MSEIARSPSYLIGDLWDLQPDIRDHLSQSGKFFYRYCIFIGQVSFNGFPSGKADTWPIWGRFWTVEPVATIKTSQIPKSQSGLSRWVSLSGYLDSHIHIQRWPDYPDFSTTACFFYFSPWFGSYCCLCICLSIWCSSFLKLAVTSLCCIISSSFYF